MNFTIIKDIYLNFVGRYSINVIVWLFGIFWAVMFLYYDGVKHTLSTPMVFVSLAFYGTTLFVIFLLIFILEQKYKFRIRTKWLLYNPLYIIPMLYWLHWTVIFIVAGIGVLIEEFLLPAF